MWIKNHREVYECSQKLDRVWHTFAKQKIIENFTHIFFFKYQEKFKAFFIEDVVYSFIEQFSI
jgi:hypothetical protein